jgi:enoyl-CoA hydratase
VSEILGEPDVLARVDAGVGHITLNRPKALNALTLPMVEELARVLTAWAADPSVKLVLLDGAGPRGLCAGGDIRSLYDAALAGDNSLAEAFFRAEYRLNAQIAAYPKPYVALMDGIVMGGGIGVAAHGSLRIVTERSRLAMPETGIGFVVDVGGTWLLGRAPDELGLHAALTAAELGPADGILCGLADVHVPSDRLASLSHALRGCDTLAAIGDCVQSHATEPAAGRLAQDRPWIAECYAAPTMEAIVAVLADQAEPAAREAAAKIVGKSPTSLKVVLRAVRLARESGGLAASLEQEYRLVLHSVQTHDFREGVRAAIIDKDRNPAWSPARLEDVDDAAVAAFFEASDHGGLGLSPR